MKWCNKMLLKLPQIAKYLLNSCLSMVVDVGIVFLFYNYCKVSLVVANTIGVFCGFLVGYLLTSKYVFRKARGLKGSFYYILTFILGLLMADWLIYIGNTVLFTKASYGINFILSKGLSVIIPFFFLYYLRKWIYQGMEKEESDEISTI